MRFVKNSAIMRMTILLFLLSQSVYILNAQNKPDKEFLNFAQKQDSLFTRAYQQRDIISFHALLSEFMEKYNLLKPSDKRAFNGYYINASYNLCCTYALLNNKKQALYYLNKSIKDGYSDYLHLQGDSDLTILGNEAEFKKLIQSLRETADYQYILQKAAVYNLNDKREVPSFTYQSSEQSDLVSLRKTFKLDSVAGSGNEVSKILNLMHWMHNLIPHDGNHENPIVKNAMNMIMVCKKDARGLNCRGLATVLNECYLAMGYKSRFVTCLPKDSLGTDNDCHVINMVYSNSLQKWLWIDPTFDAYVMNEKGELLSIEEVRNRIILNEPLIINPDANWNHRESQTKSSYLDYYMAKNLYRLQCPLSSEYDLETRKAGKEIIYLDLLPLDYFRQSPDRTVDTYNDTKLIFYKTNNSTIFWQKP